jgi:hypothetical protein
MFGRRSNLFMLAYMYFRLMLARYVIERAILFYAFVESIGSRDTYKGLAYKILTVFVLE